PQEIAATPLPLMPISEQPLAPTPPALQPPPAPPRRSSAPKFRLLDEDAERKRSAPPPKPRRYKRRGPWLKRVAVLLLLAGAGATGLGAVDNLWITYNTERKARLASFDPARVTRDQSLWASVDSVSRRFDNSGCPRP